MAKKNRTCAVCQTAYSFCPNCEKNYTDPQPSWKIMFDEENCYKIFEILSAYSCEQISEDAAREGLESCDLSNQKNFREDSKRVLDRLYKKKKLAKTIVLDKKDEKFKL